MKASVLIREKQSYTNTLPLLHSLPEPMPKACGLCEMIVIPVTQDSLSLINMWMVRMNFHHLPLCPDIN